MSKTFQFPAQDCLSVFCEYMEVKAEHLGLSNNTLFRDPCGIDNLSTAKDMLRCLLRAGECAALRDVWKPKHTISTKNGSLELISTVFNDPTGILTEAYDIVGGKTGTLTPYKAYNLSVIVKPKNSNTLLACTVMSAETKNGEGADRFTAARQALDLAVKKLADPTFAADENAVCAKSAVVCKVPPLAADEYHQKLEILFEKNSGEQLRPASMTKLLTSVIVAEQVKDLSAPVCVTQDALALIPNGYYGDDLHVGDTLTVRELLYALMLPSSNAAAYILAVHVGNLLLNDFS